MLSAMISRRTQNGFGLLSRARDRNPLVLLHWLTRRATYIVTPQRKQKSSTSNSSPSTRRKTQTTSQIKVQAHSHRWTTSSSIQTEWRSYLKTFAHSNLQALTEYQPLFLELQLKNYLQYWVWYTSVHSTMAVFLLTGERLSLYLCIRKVRNTYHPITDLSP